jgi:predicted alpha/beta hydrolase
MARLEVPALVISITDDAFAPEIAVRRFLMGLPSTPIVRRTLSAVNKQSTIGHFGYFRSARSNLWKIVTRFIQTTLTSDGSSTKTS